MSDELPPTWATAPLSDLLVTLESGSRPRGGVRGISEGVPSIGGEHLKYDGKFDFSSVKYVPEKFAAEMTKGRIQSNDILVVKDGATTGKTAFVDSTFPFRNAVVNEHVFICRPASELEPKFLFRFLMSKDGQERILENFKGSAQGGINQSFARYTEVPLAPLAEQRRIVAKLETLLGKVCACQQRLAKIPVLLKRFRQSVLAAACSGRLTADWREENSSVEDASRLIAELERVHEAAGGHKTGNAAPPSDEAHDLTVDDLPSTWRLTEMRSVVCPDRPITYGILKPGPETPGGVPYVRVADFPNDRLNLETIRRTTKEIEKTFARARLRAGDILLSIRGTVGRVCVVPPELENANITQDTARLSVQPALDAGFVKWFLRAAPTQKRMQKAVKGVAVRGINIGDVRALQMPVPPLAEQQEIVRRVESLLALADQIEARFHAAQTQVAIQGIRFNGVVNGRQVDMGLVFEIQPLIADYGQKKAYHPITVGLAVLNGNARLVDGEPVHGTPAQWPKSDRAEFWVGLLREVDKLGGLLIPKSESQESVILTVNAQLKVPADWWRPENRSALLKGIMDAQSQAGEVVGISVQPAGSPPAIQPPAACVVCGWQHDVGFTQLRLDDGAVVSLRGILPEILALVHRAHEQGFPSLSTKDEELLKTCAGYGNPCKAFDDLKQRQTYKLLFDTSRRGFIALRGAVGRNRNKSESRPE